MEKPLISIVMVNYNHEETIGPAIESVLAQTYQNWELIIVDDGSTDNSVAIVETYAKKDARIKFYPQKQNRQICVVTNIGFRYVTGEYVARLDSDDLWLSEKLEKQLRYMKSHPEGELCFTKLDIINENGEIINEKLPDYYEAYNKRQADRNGWLRYFFFQGNTLIQSSLLMKREVLDRVGVFNLAYMQAHDFDFFVRAIKKYNFLFLEEPLTRYRRTEAQNSAWNDDNNRRFLNEFMNIRFHFFDDMTDEQFREAFRESFRNPDSATHEELLCEQAFLLSGCMGGEEPNPVLGLKKMEELMKNPDIVTVLEEKFSYTPKDYYKQSVRPLFATEDILGELEYLRRLRPMLEERIEGMEQARLVQIEENQKLREKIAGQELMLADQNLMLTEQQKVIESMENSTSWKITKPLRNAKKILRKD